MTLWTFRFQGGTSFTLRVPWNPPVEHDGYLTVAHLLCSEEMYQVVLRFVEGQGTRVLSHSEGQTDEQAEERRRLLGDPDALFPCVKCPGCFWFDPTLPGMCGAKEWEPSFREAAVRVHERAREGLAECPVLP